MAVPHAGPNPNPVPQGTPNTSQQTAPMSPDDQLHVVVVLVGLVLMFGAVLLAVLYYGKSGETSAAGILGVFLPAVTGIVGFVFGIKTGATEGSKAGDKVAAHAQQQATSTATTGLNSLDAFAQSVEGVLEGLSAAPSGGKTLQMQSMDRTAGAPAKVDLETLRRQFAGAVGELRGHLKSMGGLP